jgi:hypothetical protein
MLGIASKDKSLLVLFFRKELLPCIFSNLARASK